MIDLVEMEELIDALAKGGVDYTRECKKCKRCFMIEGSEVQMMNAKHIQYKGVCYECDGLKITHECSTIYCKDCDTPQQFPIAMGANLDNVTSCLVCGSKNITKTKVDEDKIIVTKIK